VQIYRPRCVFAGLFCGYTLYAIFLLNVLRYCRGYFDPLCRALWRICKVLFQFSPHRLCNVRIYRSLLRICRALLRIRFALFFEKRRCSKALTRRNLRVRKRTLHVHKRALHIRRRDLSIRTLQRRRGEAQKPAKSASPLLSSCESRTEHIYA